MPLQPPTPAHLADVPSPLGLPPPGANARPGHAIAVAVAAVLAQTAVRRAYTVVVARRARPKVIAGRTVRPPQARS